MGFRCELCATLVLGGTWVDAGCGLARVCHPCGDGRNPWHRVDGQSVKPNWPPALSADRSSSSLIAPFASDARAHESWRGIESGTGV
jgi:hypothetical protein